MKLLCLLTLFVLSATAKVQVRQDSLRAVTAQSLREGKAAEIRCRDVQVTVDSARAPGVIVMASDPQTGLYWWIYQLSSPDAPRPGLAEELESYSLYFTGDKAVGFMYLNPYLWIREVRGHAADLNAIQTLAVAEIERASKPADQWAIDQFISVPVGARLSTEFLGLNRALPVMRLPIQSVQHSGEGWTIVLRGAQGNLATIVLDDNYKLLRAEESQTPRTPRVP